MNVKRTTTQVKDRYGTYEYFEPLDSCGLCKDCSHLCYEDDYQQVYCDSKGCKLTAQ